MLWRALLPKRNDFSGFPYIVPNGVLRKVNLVPHRLMCCKVKMSRNPESLCAPRGGKASPEAFCHQATRKGWTDGPGHCSACPRSFGVPVCVVPSGRGLGISKSASLKKAIIGHSRNQQKGLNGGIGVRGQRGN